jgi:hypothetical protein
MPLSGMAESQMQLDAGEQLTYPGETSGPVM